MHQGGLVDRCAIFIDAGHLLAEGGKLCCDTRNRGDIVCDYPGLLNAVAAFAQENCGLPVLRAYWYDGARNAVPTLDHLKVAELPRVKLRLGRVSGTKQKGVDALIYRDLMTLSRQRAIATAFLVAGDEDLREGVLAAQEVGVQVVLLGIKPVKGANQSETLVQEADDHIVLSRSFLAPFLTVAPVPAPPPDPLEATSQPHDLQALVVQAAYDFVVEWITAAEINEIKDLAAQRPRIPRELDVQLIQAVEARAGSLRDNQEAKKDMRRTFWKQISDAARELGGPSAMSVAHVSDRGSHGGGPPSGTSAGGARGGT